MKIDYPSQIEIDRAVSDICGAALPERESLFTFIRNMTTQLGIRYIFSGIYDVLALSAALFSGVIIFLAVAIPHAKQVTPALSSALFIFGPFFYMAAFILCLLKENTTPGLDIKMTCKYTLYHLLAYRMLAFSLLSGVVNTVYILILCARLQLSPLYFVCLSLSSLFIFSALLMTAIFYVRSKWAMGMISAGWMALNLGIGSAFPIQYGEFLLRIPLFVWIPAGAACVAIYLYKIKNLTTNRRTLYAFS